MRIYNNKKDVKKQKSQLRRAKYGKYFKLFNAKFKFKCLFLIVIEMK